MFFIWKKNIVLLSLIRINDDIAKPEQKYLTVNFCLQSIHFKLTYAALQQSSL